MFAALRRSKVTQRSLSVFTVAALLLNLLPAPLIASTSTTTQSRPAQQIEQVGEPVPAPVPAPQWPEVGKRAQYVPGTESLAAPGTLSPAPVAETAQTPAALHRACAWCTTAAAWMP